MRGGGGGPVGGGVAGAGGAGALAAGGACADGGPLPMAVGVAVCAALAFVFTRLTLRPRGAALGAPAE